MVSMVQTQREHTKLERMLLQQQREMRKLQKAHEVTNAGMLISVPFEYSMHAENYYPCNAVKMIYTYRTTYGPRTWTEATTKVN